MNDHINYHRVFLALPIANDLLSYINQTVRQLYPNHSALRWIHDQNYHITLHYLGSISEEQLNLIQHKMKPIIENYSSFSLKLETTAGFPSSHNPHSLVILVKLSFLLNSLHEEIKNILNSCGISVSPQTYHPHLTIARIKKGMIDVSGKRLPSPLKIPVQKILLLQSLTEENQVSFHTIDSFEFNHHKIEV